MSTTIAVGDTVTGRTVGRGDETTFVVEKIHYEAERRLVDVPNADPSRFPSENDLLVGVPVTASEYADPTTGRVVAFRSSCVARRMSA